MRAQQCTGRSTEQVSSHLGDHPEREKKKKKKIQHFWREIKRYVTMKMAAFIIFDKESAQNGKLVHLYTDSDRRRCVL